MKQSTRLGVSVLSGLVAGLFGMMCVNAANSSAEAKIASIEKELGGERVEVCVATRDIAMGDQIMPEDVANIAVLKSYLPHDACSKSDEVVGRMATSNVPEGAVISEIYFQQSSDGLDVPTGFVAVSIPSTDQFAVGGALLRGDFVDVYVSSSGLTQQLIERAYVIDTSVLSTGTSAHLDWVTIAVSPENVTEVLTASSQGTIYLTLPGDISATDSVQMQDGQAEDKD